ncbi:hypothetical protein ScalyP_jg5163 [Parmales sp. scaly parma]|nr:hypothetical protein ScalyP_jg5163 [Parmales sp. scaly parma]
MIVNQISLFSSTPIEITKVSKQTYWEKENELATLKADVREHISSRDYTSALSTAQNALDLSIKHFKLNHPVTGSCHSDLALVNKELGNYDLSRELYSKAGEIYESTVGKEHPSYATMINNLGQSFKAQANSSETRGMDRMVFLDKAEECFVESNTIREENLGENHADSLISLGAVGGVQMAKKNWKAAEKTLRTVHKRSKGVGGGALASAEHNLGVCLKKHGCEGGGGVDKEGKLVEARGLYLKALEWRVKEVGEAGTATLMTMTSIAELDYELYGEKRAVVWWERIEKALGVEGGSGSV